MRDLLDKLDNIREAATLAPSELTKHEWRFRRVIEKIKTREAFQDQAGEPIIIDPREARRLTQLYNSENLAGPITVRTVDSSGNPLDPIALSALKKTPDLQKIGGTVTTDTGQQRVTKEDALVKPTQIGITDRDIAAGQLGRVIVQNTVLNSTEYGKAVVDLAKKISTGQPAILPAEYQTKDNEQLRKAIVDYAGEYLGVLALILDQTTFPKKQQFLEWLGGDLGDLIIRFPSKSNTNLADSYASITNPTTDHTLNISSKGTGGGAPPAISGLKIPPELRRSQKYKTALEFIDICQKSDRSGGPTTITSAFEAIDHIHRTNPNALPKNISKLLPFSANTRLIPFVVDAIRNRDPTSLPKKYDVITDRVSSKNATPSGKLVYEIKNIVGDAVNNNNAVPEFRDLILQILEMNFIQQYSDYANGVISFATQWPAKLEGDISLAHKSSAVSPTDGGFSFKLGRPENFGADTDLGQPGPQDNPMPGEPNKSDALTQKRSTVTARNRGAEPQGDRATLGRARRQSGR